MAIYMNAHINTAEKYGEVIEFPRMESTPKKKTSGKRSEVYNYQLADLHKMMSHFEESGQWIHWLILAIGCNTGRRIGDILKMKWSDIFNQRGGYRAEIQITEQKTGKFSSPPVNDALKAVIAKYIEMTGCEPSKDCYSHFVCEQLSGNYKGRVVSRSGHLKALKKAAEAVEIEYNVGTHSARKTFGAVSKSIHPHDADSMEILSTAYNHSSERITKRYIGLTRERINQYYADFGRVFSDTLAGKLETTTDGKTVIGVDIGDLRSIIRFAYEAGMDNKDNDKDEEMETIAMLMDLIHSAAK